MAEATGDSPADLIAGTLLGDALPDGEQAEEGGQKTLLQRNRPNRPRARTEIFRAKR